MMIRNRQVNGANAIGGDGSIRKNNSESECNNHDGFGVTPRASDGGGGDRPQNPSPAMAKPTTRKLWHSSSKEEVTTDGNSKENQEMKRCRANLRRSIIKAAKLLLVFFLIYSMVLFATLQSSPDDFPSHNFQYSSTEKFTSLRNRNNAIDFDAPSSINNSSSPPPPASGTSDRYKAKKIIHSLPTDPRDRNVIDSMVRNHQGHDDDWYEACANDNANAWRNHIRVNGGDIGKFFDRACPNTGLHPQGVHWNPFKTATHECRVTSGIELEIRRDHFSEDWEIHTLDLKGVPKPLGGDNFFIVYSEYFYDDNGPVYDSDKLRPMAVALQTDHYNGTYGLDFVSIPFMNLPSNASKHNGQRKKGILTVHVISTCFIGGLYPPLKDGWKNGGQTNVTWTIENIDRPYRIEDWYDDRYAPRRDQEARDPKSKAQNSLADFDRVVFAGDSMLTQMTWGTWMYGKRIYHPFATDKIQSGKIWVNITQEDGNPVQFHMPLSPNTATDFLAALDPWIRGGLSEPSDAATTKREALVLGSAAWDVIWPAEWQGPNFENHLSAVKGVLQHLRKRYPRVTLIWKLPYAQHMHSANHEFCFADPAISPDGGSCVRALRYATKERFEKLYKLQKQFIETTFQEDNMVRLLDLYEISYLAGGRWMIAGDSIHYHPDFNNMVLEKLLYAEEA